MVIVENLTTIKVKIRDYKHQISEIVKSINELNIKINKLVDSIQPEGKKCACMETTMKVGKR